MTGSLQPPDLVWSVVPWLSLSMCEVRNWGDWVWFHLLVVLPVGPLHQGEDYYQDCIHYSNYPIYILLCCLSLGICLAPISLSLPYSHPIILFILRITLCFHLSQIPWSPCDPCALPLPHVFLLLISSISYSSCLMYISNSSLYALLISVLLIFHRLLIYPLLCLLLISNLCFQHYINPSSYL